MEFIKSDDDIPLLKQIWRFTVVFLLSWGRILFFPIKLLLKLTQITLDKLGLAKAFMVKKLLWKRSILGRPIIHTGSLLMAGILILLSTVVGANKTFSQTDVSKQLQPKFVPEYQSAMAQEETDTLIEAVPVKTIIPANRPREGIIQYTVADGDTLSSLAEKFSISAETIAYANDLDQDDSLSNGTQLDILPASGYVHTVEAGDTIEGISLSTGVPPQVLVETNWLTKPYTLYIGQQLIIPGDIPKPQQPTPQPQSPVPAPSIEWQVPATPPGATGQFIWPTAGGMTRGFGWYYGYFHDAIDIANQSCGGAVMAAESGTVIAAGWRAGGWGNTVWIDHGNGYVTRYAHLSSVAVVQGTGVSQGQVIGAVGDTGLAYGCHLHFVVEYNGSAIDPLGVL